MAIRFPRFKRAATPPPIHLTDRDREIIRLVYRNRFLRSSHLISLLAASRQQVLRRLQLLYQNGYLTRPRVQIDYFHEGRSKHIVYGIGNKSVPLLKQEFGMAFHNISVKDYRVGRFFFEHALSISDFMVTLEVACRKSGNIRLITAEELSPSRHLYASHTLRWSVHLSPKVKLGIIPDRVFALERYGEPLAYFFLEADQGTMPVIRKGLSQSSFYRKLLAYQKTWETGLHRNEFGFNRFRVLTLTTTPARVQSLIDACGRLKRGHGLFLFIDRDSIQNSKNLFTLRWRTGRCDEDTFGL